MSLITNIKNTFALTALLFLFTACGGGGGSTGSSVSNTNGDSLATSGEPTTQTSTPTSTVKVVEVQTIESTVTENSATIKWIENDYTTELIEYGTSEKYGSEILVQEEGTINYKKSNSELLVESAVTLSELEAGTTYNYRIVGKDKDGKKVVSRNKTFRTPKSIVTEPVPTEPIVTEPVPTEPIVTEPVPTEPIVTEPVPTEPIVTEPVPTEPIVTEPVPTEPIVTEPVPTEPIVEETQAVCIKGDAKIEGHVTDKDTGAGLVGVQVNIGGCVTTTDDQGDYTLTDIAANDKEVVTFSAEGYYKNSIIIQIDKYSEGTTDLSPNYSEVKLDKYISHWAYDSQTYTVSGSHIKVPNGIYINSDGSPYIGQVTAGLSYRTSAEKGTDTVFPGEYKGKDSYGIIIPFVSYGFMVIDFTDVNGATLSVSENITLTFEATGATENILPLWYYDYLQGLWIEEGYAELQADGTYSGEISHPGAWSLNRPVEDEAGIYRGRIINEDGSSMSDVRVYAVGENWIGSDLSTDEDGLFEIEVIPGSSFHLAAYDYKNKYGANYDSIIAAIASGEIVED